MSKVGGHNLCLGVSRQCVGEEGLGRDWAAGAIEATTACSVWDCCS